MDALRDEVKEFERKYKEVEKLEESKSQLKDLEKELAWTWVVEKKKEVDSVKTAETKCNTTIQTYTDKLDEIKEQIEQVEITKTEKNEELTVLNDAAAELLREKTEIMANCKLTRKAATQAVQASSRCQRDIERAAQDRDTLMRRIDELTLASQQDQDDERLRREEILTGEFSFDFVIYCNIL